MAERFTRDTFPATPAGMVQIAYCGSYDPALDGETTVLEQAPGIMHGHPTVRLVFTTRGYALAGSMMRWDEASWGVLYEPGDGTRHGQRFLPTEEGEAKARALFAKWTDPQEVSRRRQEAARLEEEVYAPARAKRAAELEAERARERERKNALARFRRAQRKGKAA